MSDALRSILILGAGLTCGLAITGAVHYLRAFRRQHERFDLALAMTLGGTMGLSLYVLLVTLDRLGEPGLGWTFGLALLSVLALAFGLLGMIVERGRAERVGRRWMR